MDKRFFLKKPKSSFKQLLISLTNNVKKDAFETLRCFNDYLSYCKIQKLVVSQDSISFIRDQLQLSITLLTNLTKNFVSKKYNSAACNVAESELRVAMRSLASIKTYLGWRSPSRAQSAVPMFYNLFNQNFGEYFYERYNFREVERIEAQILNIFNLSATKYCATITNSGMAAYSLLESFLIREVLVLGDTILIAPYIYFEIAEQLETIPWIKVIRSTSYQIDDLILIIEKAKPKVVFLETLTNNGDLRLVDVEALLGHFQDATTSPFFVIDGTMTSCLSNFLAKLDNRNKIFYIESCSKYLQCGLELTLAGVLICDVQFKSKLHILRRNAGLILTEQNAYMFPIYNRTMMQDRLGRMAYNASYVAKKLSQIDEVTAFCEIIHPSLETHPDHMLASRLHILGACIVVRLKSDGVMLDNQNKFTNCLISTAKRHNFPLVMGESFGFSFPRITIAFTGNASSFIRLYVGDVWQMNDKLVQVVYETVTKLMSYSDHIPVKIVTQNKFSDHDVQMIISEIERMNEHGDALGLIISMMYRYGLDMNMIMFLTWSQIDFDNNILKVHEEKEARIYPLSISDAKILLKLRQENTETVRVFDLKNSAITQYSLSRALKKAVKNTGINKIVSLKILQLQRSKYLTVGQKYLYQ